ncbi:MAG: tetratricopeptide repeat protein [Chitinophagaceae bacterium]|nr:tetratricopeptide repeat protein [Chitinophagaceae bacterium]
MYAEPALNLVDKLLLKTHTEEEREKLFDQEQGLLYSVVAYYTNNDTTDWKKVSIYNESRLKAIEKTGNQKRTAEFLFHIATISLDGKKDSAMFFTNMYKSVAIFNEIKDSTYTVYGYRFISRFSRSAGDFTKAFESIQSAIAISRKLNYLKGLASSLAQLADLYRDYGEDDQALENYQSALDILYKAKDTNTLFNALGSLGGFYYSKHNTAKALEYYNKLIEICARQSKPYHNAGSVYKWIGMTYSDSNDYGNALLNFEKSLHLFDSARDFFETGDVLNEIGSLYAKQRDFNNAISYHTRSVKIADSMNMQGTKPVWLYSLALDYYGLRNYIKAKEINDQALVGFKKHWFDVKITSDMELLAAQIDSARGDGMGAFTHYKEYVSLIEKLKGEEISKEAQKEKFRNESEKQKSEQEKKDAIAKRTRNLQYMAIGAFLLMGIFLLYGYVQKNRDKKRIEKAYGELKSTQAQLIQSEKMASLGELTAGIAHEIQNPLNFVNNFSEVSNELISEMVEEVDKGNTAEVKVIAKDVQQNLEKILHHGKRADAIVKGMLQHSRSSSGVKEPTDINALADEYLRLAYHGLRAKDKSFNATMKTDFDESIGNINIIPQDMGRVILNLITNAFYVVDEKKKSPHPLKGREPYEPTVTVTTKKLGSPQTGGDGGKVEISVKDNGNGIPQKVMDKIFQPFFTTKPTGQGTGLGLSLSYDIVKAHGGELKVETKEGEGSEFIILLPVV